MANKNSLLNEISSLEALNDAWKQLNKSNENSYGLSRETIKQFKDNLPDKIQSIRNELLANKFKFSPTRAAAIPKDNGKYRPLQIPEIKDRLVLKSIAITLEKELNLILKEGEGVSFAYQKGIGIKDAVARLEKLYKEGNTIILEADIINFFGEVNKNDLLTKKVFPNLRDTTINSLIKKALNQKVEGLDKIKKELQGLFKNLNEGIPQGNPLSPLLSNVYLSEFDKEMKSKNQGLIRYADDFVILAKDRKNAMDSYRLALEVLEKRLKLRVHEMKINDPKAKTKIVDPKVDDFSFLSIAFDGKKFFPSRKNVSKLLIKIERIIHSKKTGNNVLSILQNVNNSLDGWVSNYSFIDCDRYFSEIDSYIDLQVYQRLRKLEWRFTLDSKGKIPFKHAIEGKNRDCISRKQRINSGIALSKVIAKKRREKKQKKEDFSAGTPVDAG